MRVMVFFDLPTVTAIDRKRYQQFRKTLLKEGFLMLQESVYVRVAANRQSATFLENRISQAAPPNGVIQSLIVTEKQYATMRFLTGEQIQDWRNSDQRTVII